jgi:pilus assembly protein CpaD
MTIPDASRAFRRRALACVLLASLGGGCAFTARDETTGSVPNDYRLRHPIGIKEAEQTLELLIGNRRGGLNPSQRSEVLAFGRVWRNEATGGVIIDVPAGTPNARAAADALKEVRSLLASSGVPASAIQTRGYRPADPLGFATLKLNYPRMSAHTGSCGLWPADLGPTMDPEWNQNRPFWNLGCANQRNLAAMVDNPADLIQPRAETQTYTARRTTAMEKYRSGQSPATEYPDAEQGRISDVGQ